MRTHPDFNREGPWAGSAAGRVIRVWDHSQPEVLLLFPWKQRADGTPWIEKAETDDAPTPPKKKDKSCDRDYYCGNRGNRDNDR